MSKIVYVNLGDLNLPEFQAHRQTPLDHIKEISESIKSIGIIEPLIVRDTDNGLEIVAGCIRYQAAMLAGLKAVPCINMSLDPQAAEILKLHENIKRVPLDHVDQGHTFVMMMDAFNMSERSIAECVGKSAGYVSQHVSLVKFGHELSQSVKQGEISFSQSRELMRIDDTSERKRLLNYCKNEGATIDVLRRWVQEFLTSSPAPELPEESTPEQIPIHNDPHISRFCEACNNSVEISQIRQVFYCSTCHLAIKTAISEEKAQLSSKSPEETSPEAQG